MQIESSVTSISWIPLEAVQGMPKLPFEAGIAHYDLPPPDAIDDLDRLRLKDAFRFANNLRAWIEVEDDKIVRYGHLGKGHIGQTRMRLGPKEVVFQAAAFPDLRPEPEVADTWVRFVQTAGGRTGAPAPRRVRRAPFVQLDAPLAWTTLALTIHVDGSSAHELVGASPFPRHWVYDFTGRLAAKSGLIDFKTWWRDAFGDHTPWGERDSPAVVAQVESALERELSGIILQDGTAPNLRKVAPGRTLVEQGDAGDEVFLVLDGMLLVEVDGEPVAEFGPGAILGEQALFEGGTRIATLRARTPCRIVVVSGEDLDRDALTELARSRRPESPAAALSSRDPTGR